MPKLPRSKSDVEAVRESILDAALEILYQEGFKDLSMRKIAKKIKMTAANLYNYFTGKDEIYLAIQIRGFAQMVEEFTAIDASGFDPFEKVRKMILAYIDFGTRFPDQYEIMFTRNTPKYADYVGTPLESAAAAEKKTALQVAEIAGKAIFEAGVGRGVVPPSDPARLTLQVWTALHGVVSLINSRVLQEVEPDTRAVIDAVTSDLMARLLQNTEPSGATGTYQ